MGKFLFTISIFLIFHSVSHGQDTEASVDTDLEEYDFRDLETGSDEFGSYSIGHNLSTNARNLKKGQSSVGTLYVGHGLTDNWTIGTSSFVMHTFMMFNVMSRHGYQWNKKQRVSLELAYFKTFGGREIDQGECYYVDTSEEPYCPKTTVGFLMEAANAKVTFSQQVVDYYRFNTTFSYFYYWDDRNPFSFRMDPGNEDRYTTNLTTLHEIRLNENLFLNYELGIWGMNYQYPYLHTGLTLGMQTYKWLISIGGSTTYSFSFPEDRLKYFIGGYTSRASYHPEIQAQYFF